MTDLQEHQKWMQLALDEAAKSGEDVPVGAVIVLQGEAIGVGVNQRESKADPTGHAEIVAIKMAAARLGKWRLDNATLYTSLEPCAMCAEAAIQSRVARIIFGAYDPRSGACGSALNLFLPGRLYPIPEVLGGILEEPCGKILTDFFKSRVREED